MIELKIVEPPPCNHCELPRKVEYLCHGCGTLYRSPAGLNHFARFGFEPQLSLDLETLERRYFDLSRRLHPDRQIKKQASQQSRALILSSELNEAYRVLTNERLRAEHLLQLVGGDSAEQDKSTPQELLIEILELREEVEEARIAGNTDRLQAIRRLSKQRENETWTQVRQLFAAEAFPTPELLKAARGRLNELKYWVNLRAEAWSA